ncbi:unnamed protein product [Prorocentrum cordatum]|uniref:Endonuclease/exonuclease/phosphatase domain-containing protein n=1 Tax=Prorocentrum cordatum TaxID=2364126 RepID=A0ABN9VV87_9DINO|nr:unnamed protein product [Polarella glacialis]
MLRKLLPGRGGGGPPGGAEASSREEAEAALAAWEAALGSGGEASSEPLEKALSAVLAVPPEAREPLEGALRRLAERLPAALAAPSEEAEGGSRDTLQAALSILRLGRSDSAELASALAAVVLATRRSEALEDASAEAAACAAARDDAAACPAVRLAAALQGARALAGARGLCEGALRSRGERLEAAAASLEAPRLAAQRRREEAALRRAELEAELESLNTPAQGSPVAAEDPGVALEAEVERLAALRQQLLAELDEVSLRHGDAAARQRAHMTQVDGWRLDRERALAATRGSEKEVLAELGSLERQAEACDALATRLAEVVEVQRGALDEHAPALGGAGDDVRSAAAAVLAESEAGGSARSVDGGIARELAELKRKYAALQKSKAESPAEPAPPPDPLELEVQRWEGIVAQFAKSGLGADVPSRVSAEQSLAAARKARNDAKPQLARHTTLGHKLQDAIKRQQKLESDVSAQVRVVEAAEEHLQELKAKVLAAKDLVGTLQAELRESCPKDLRPEGSEAVAFVLPDLPTTVLEADADLKAMVESPIFDKFKEAVRAAAAAQAASAGPTSAGPAGTDSGESVPVPADGDEYIDVDEEGISQVMSTTKFSGDKRELQELFKSLGLVAKKPRKVLPPTSTATQFIETFNGSGWSTLRERLTMTTSVFVCAQELGLSELTAPQSLAAVRALGWRFLISESYFNAKTQRCSAGVGVFVRDGFGLRWTDPTCKAIVPHRAIQVTVDLPGFSFNIVCAYFHVNDGVREKNLSLLSAIGAKIVEPPLTVIAADWNNSPAAVEATGFVQKLKAVILAPAAITCRTRARVQSVWEPIVHRRQEPDDGTLVANCWQWMCGMLSEFLSLTRREDVDWVSGEGAHHLLAVRVPHAGEGLCARLDRSLASVRLLLTQWSPQMSGDSEWWDTAAALAEELAAECDEVQAEHSKARDRSWKEWHISALSGSAKRMHRLTRIKKLWEPTVSSSVPGSFTSEPCQLVQEETVKLGGFWHAEVEPPEAWIPDREALQPLTQWSLGLATMSFDNSIDGLLESVLARLLRRPLPLRSVLTWLLLVLVLLLVLRWTFTNFKIFFDDNQIEHARLDAALARARGRQAEHRRARQRLELLEVGASQADLPTRAALEAALAALRDAWAARAGLGGVELQRRFEVEALIKEAEADAGCAATAEPLADLKAAWARHWAELGDAGAALAEAAGGAGTVLAGGIGTDLSELAVAERTETTEEGAVGRLPPPALPTLADDEPLLG